MTKSRESPIFGASRRSSRAHRAWNVESQTPFEPRRSSASTRSRISPAALFVNVTASTSSGVRVTVADEVRDAVRDDARLARAGAGENQQRPVEVQHRFALLGVEF